MTNILVCDDDREIVDAIEIYLLQEGYRIFKAYDGEQAIRVLKEQNIQLLIIDIMMPKLDGIHATLKIREYSSIPFIFYQQKKNVILNWCQTHAFSVHGDLLGIVIDTKASRRKKRIVLHIQIPKLGISAQIGFHPCHKLKRIKGLRNIIIRSDIQSENLIRIL